MIVGRRCAFWSTSDRDTHRTELRHRVKKVGLSDGSTFGRLVAGGGWHNGRVRASGTGGGTSWGDCPRAVTARGSTSPALPLP